MPDHNLRHPIDLAPPRGGPAGRHGLKIAGIVAAIAFVTAAIVLVSGGVSRPNAELAPRPPSTAAQTVVVVPVAEQALTRTIIGDGSVVAWQELVVDFETGGLRVVEVAFEEGDRVTAGQIMARLDDTVPAAQLAQAEAALAEAEAALDIARLELRRATELARGNDIARQTLEQRQSAARQAEARLLAARARRDETAARLAQTRVLAPADGIVSRRAILPGAVAQPAVKRRSAAEITRITFFVIILPLMVDTNTATLPGYIIPKTGEKGTRIMPVAVIGRGSGR